MKLSLKFMISAILIALLPVYSIISFAAIDADQLVKDTANDVLSIIKNDKEIQAGNTQKIYLLAEEKILPNFDFERVCRMVLGKNWRDANDAQKAGFQKEFRSLLIRTYASALGKYRNQEIVYKPATLSADKTVATVKTEILQDSGPSIAVGYTLKLEDDAWKVFDIEIEKISLVTNYRSQFSSEIRQNGLDSLINKLAEKNKASGLN